MIFTKMKKVKRHLSIVPEFTVIDVMLELMTQVKTVPSKKFDPEMTTRDKPVSCIAVVITEDKL